jgi:hypothetical protein
MMGTTHVKGIDCDSIVTPARAQALANSGYKWVGRYINPGKASRLTREEAATLTAHGLYIVSIWEEGSPTTEGYFSLERGQQHGRAALSAMATVGQPCGTPVYFTVDGDLDPEGAVVEYFRGLAGTFSSPCHPVGAYGSGRVLLHLKGNGLAQRFWLAGSRGWPGYEAARSFAHIIQLQEGVARCGLEVDQDGSNGSAGGWKLR